MSGNLSEQINYYVGWNSEIWYGDSQEHRRGLFVSLKASNFQLFFCISYRSTLLVPHFRHRDQEEHKDSDVTF